MLPKYHLILGILFSGFLFYFFPKIGLIGFIIIILSSFLIDIDHYLYYAYKKKSWNLKKAYKWFIEKRKKLFSLPKIQRKRFYMGFCLFHNVEILIILFFLGRFLSIYFYCILLGFFFHLFLDIIYQLNYIGKVDKFSFIYDLFKFKKLKFIEDKEL